MLRAVVHVFTVFLFFFNDPATPEIYTLSLHDALPICWRPVRQGPPAPSTPAGPGTRTGPQADRKSGSAGMPRPISYAVFCLQNTAQCPGLHGLSCAQRLPAVALPERAASC